MEGEHDLKNKLEFQLFLLFFLGYSVCYLIPRIFDNVIIPVFYCISELQELVSFMISLSIFLEIFLTGPVFSIIAWMVFEKIFMKKNDKNHENLTPRTIFLLKVIFFLAIGTMCLGNAVHLVVNDLNNRAFDLTKILTDPNYADLYYSIYFWDELFGHMALAVPLFVLLGIYAFGFYNEPPSRPLRWFEWLFVTLVGIGYGINWFYGFTEGQATFVIFIINIILTGMILSWQFKKKLTIKEHPFIYAILVEVIVFIICTIIWGVLTGIKPYYPFFYQPGETIWS
ncbi:MAG: hypothetical protein ACTSVY_03105 [Candidatus Helarchaeota archaeon]